MIAQLTAIALVLAVAHADILHLRDGIRHHGTLIRQDDKTVVFRIETPGGGASVVRQFDRRDVKEIEVRTAGEASSEPAKPVSKPLPTTGAENPLVEQMLREALELSADGDRAAALRAMQRVVARAGKPQLATLDASMRKTHARSLATTMAATRIAAALEIGRGRGFEIRFATPFETADLAAQLEALHIDLGATPVGGRKLIDWSADDYTVLDADARMLVRRAQLFAGVIGARLQFDARLKDRGPARADLVNLRRRMADLAAHISSLRGYTNPVGREDDEDDPTLLVARVLAAASLPASQPASRPDDDAAASQPSAKDGDR